MDLQGLYFSPCIFLFIAGKCHHILYIFMTFSMLLWFQNHPSYVFWSNSRRWILGFWSRHCKVRGCMHGKWCQEIGFIPYSLPTPWITIGQSIIFRYLGFSFRKMKSIGGLPIDAKVYQPSLLASMPAQPPGPMLELKLCHTSHMGLSVRWGGFKVWKPLTPKSHLGAQNFQAMTWQEGVRDAKKIQWVVSVWDPLISIYQTWWSHHSICFKS